MDIKNIIKKLLIHLLIFSLFFVVYNMLIRRRIYTEIDWLDYVVYLFIITIPVVLGQLSKGKFEKNKGNNKCP
ncbi:hypothetical protein [Ruminiclostridium papyrosolvens]|uniref:Uncharacterized protein n=1 Tax=Ruminiclostridium papyrosolvens C7 TaxID=1330534 RepID=U4R6F1_9FIRM|nr:hypothetical protein [Ruminiclostridium papyrosolvens]EPR13639.1 hypothetical protein L323_03370 [Ruminiclostridium papyrosolvens C7]